MGHNPLPPRAGITTDQAAYRLARATGADSELFHLGRAREAFARGRLDVDELERAVEHVLRGGYLNEDLKPRAPIMDRVRRRRRQKTCSHDDLYEFRSMMGDERMFCGRCGASDI